MAAALHLSKLAIVRASPAKRLWLGAAGVAIFISIAWTAHALFPPPGPKEPGFGLDFIAFYTAGTFVREGRTGQLYDLEAVHQFQRELAARNHFDIGRTYGPWWNPPFYALVFAPLAGLSYPLASGVWIGIGLMCFAIACWLLWGMLPERLGPKSRALAPVLMILSTPFILAVSHAQNTFTSLVLLIAVVLCWRARRALAAGLVGGLMFYKPQVAAVLALVLVLDLGWKTLAGYAITGAALLLINVVALPGTLGDYLHRLPGNVHSFQTGTPYPWEQHVTLKAFWRLLLQGHSFGDATLAVTALHLTCVLAIGLLLVGAAIGLRVAEQRQDLGASKLRRDRTIAATIIATPLLMPFYFDYDLLLLSVPAVLLAAELIERGPALLQRPDRWLLAAWCALYVWQMVNTDVAVKTHLSLSVPLLTAICLMSIARCFRPEVATRSADRYDSVPLSAAA